ncbi:MAG: hypothetical protein M1820_009782 [Bogoriella megaspora]|nr:MAG: hypothetical protein M1820_009782 [Bogoriella megaspora]
MEYLNQLGTAALKAGHELAVNVVNGHEINKDAPFSPEVPLDLKNSMPDLLDRFCLVLPGDHSKPVDPEKHSVWILDNTAFRLPDDESARKALNVQDPSAPWHVEFVAAFFIKDSGKNASEIVAKIADKIDLSPDDIETRKLIASRLQPFLDTVLPNHTVQMSIHKSLEKTLGPSNHQGISSQVLSLPLTPNPTTAECQSAASPSSSTIFVEPTGWAVISDIDDTIKITQTPSAIGTLKTTFAEPVPQPVAGMPDFYAYLNTALKDPAFFYLSASPYNLYTFLKDFRDKNYPPGTIILRDASWQNLGGLISSLTLGTQDYKADRMVKIHSWLPQRKIVCIGDSTQKDPEAYAETAKKFPGWVKKIFIRKVTGIAELNEEDKNSDERFEKAFEGLDRGLWHVFEEPGELKALVDGLVKKDVA